MTLYPASFLSDLLDPASVVFDMQRNDELSGSGDGQTWQAQLAPPLWSVTVALNPTDHDHARALESRVRALRGAANTFLFADPGYRGPQAGNPGGAVTLTAIAGARNVLTLGGLPVGFEVAPGDRISIAWGRDRHYLGEVHAGATAGAGGTAVITVEPSLPFGVAPGLAVEMMKPVARMMLAGFTPFTIYSGYAGGASVKMLQKL